MSVVEYQKAMSFPDQHFWQSDSMMSLERLIMSITIAIVVMRGILSFGKDFVRFSGWMLSIFGYNFRQFRDVGIQTEEYEYPKLPDQMFFKKGSDLYHLRACHFLGGDERELYSKRACHQCKGRF